MSGARRSARGGLIMAAAAACLLFLGATYAMAGGGFDQRFSGDGKRTADLGGDEDLSGVATIGNRRIVVAGHTDAAGDDDFMVTRYRRNGARDESFSGDGNALVGFLGLDHGRAVALDDRQRIVVAGVSDLNGDADVAVARFRRGGGLDPSFSGDGKLRLDLGGDDGASGIAIQRNGRIVLSAHSTVGADDDFHVVRLKPNGALDGSFSGDGFARTDFGGDERASALAFAGRRIVVAGHGDAGGDRDFAIARYRAGGGLDPKFSGDGRQLLDFGVGDEAASAVARAPQGRIVVVGAGDGDWVLARLRRNGKADRTFSGDGRRITDPGGSGDGLYAVVATRKRIIVAGETNRSGNRRFGTGRYRLGGGLDKSFLGGGIRSFTVSPGAQNEGARDMVVQPDGRILAVGFTYDGESDQALVRLRP